ncbi:MULTISPECIES: DUF3598 family protein [Kamptonema]|uniref:DUF3598 family protein n=1 Tax=Kamptonema TaxID=1501433 RepID=UPI0001DACEC7|nr:MULTISPECIES: DUF3598 family protein [Kamptonema]CBN55095.1 conserved hypothetical protein [Kamptonema sp. PCC 6506]
MSQQWDNFLKNLGVWEGTFTKFSPLGEQLEDIPSILSLEGLNNKKSARLTLRRFLPNPNNASESTVNELVREYQYLGRDILFFENGAFSQGSIQLAPYSEFGAELSFIYGNQRLRLVQLCDRDGNLASLTLIREKLAGKDVPEKPPLKVDDLIGEWRGEAVTIYPDWRPSDSYPTSLQLHRDDHNQLLQKITFGSGLDIKTIASSALIDGSILRFNQSSQAMQVLLLPGGASATTPVPVQRRKSFFLEAGWLVESDLRQRMIRSYNENGEWVSLTLITERKVS